MIGNDHAQAMHVWGGGDDYELAFTAPRDWQMGKQLSEFSDVPITAIGEVFLANGNAGDVILVDENDDAIDIGESGFRHF